MWKYLAALVVLLAIGGAQAEVTIPDCVDCYANIVNQDDTQTINNVILGNDGGFDATVGNEGLSAGIIKTVTPTGESSSVPGFKDAPFARIDQVQDQSISNLGTASTVGAKGVTINKAIQSSWLADQGLKENELDGCTNCGGTADWQKEGAYVSQSTTQKIDLITNYDCQDDAQVFNADNKLAMIVDDLTEIITLTGTAKTTAEDSQTSTGTIKNDVNIEV
jgi:hypothetical protein